MSIRSANVLWKSFLRLLRSFWKSKPILHVSYLKDWFNRLRFHVTMHVIWTWTFMPYVIRSIVILNQLGYLLLMFFILIWILPITCLTHDIKIFEGNEWQVVSKMTEFHTEGDNYEKSIWNHRDIITNELIYDFTKNLKLFSEWVHHSFPQNQTQPVTTFTISGLLWYSKTVLAFHGTTLFKD